MDNNKALKAREAEKLDQLNKLKSQNEAIMNEMLQMKMQINEQLEKLDATDRMVKKKEHELVAERETTEKLKILLKQALAGRKGEAEDEPTRKQSMENESQEDKVTLEKFLAIMQAIKVADFVNEE